MSELKLKVYENDMKTVKKECTAQTVEVPFGAVRRLMRLFDIDSKNNNADILKTVISAWDSVVSILDNVFPEMTEEDWDFVSTKELAAVVYKLIQAALVDLMQIPKDPKN
jgi:hypothetical protein